METLVPVVTLGEMADSYYTARAARLAKEKELEALKDMEATAKKIVMDVLKTNGLEGAKGSIANVSITRKKQADVINREMVEDYIRETGDVGMLQFRVSITRCKELWDDGITIPGIEETEVEDISLTKVSKK
jgi:hypothetical protein